MNYSRQYVVLGILFAIAFLVQARLSVELLRAVLWPESRAGRVVNVADGSNRASWISRAATEAGLKPGDSIIAVNDRSYGGEGQIATALRDIGPGGTLKVNFERDGEARVAMIVAPRADGLPWMGRIIVLIYRFVLPVFSLALGFFVAAQRPADRLAWIVLGLMMSFSQVAVGTGMQNYALGWEDWTRPLAFGYIGLLTTTWPIAMLWFGVYFPERSRLDRAAPWLKWVVIAPIAIWGPLRAIASVLNAENWRAAAAFVPMLEVAGRWVFLFFAVPISLFFFQLGEKSGTLPSRDSRRRLRFIWIGTGLSMMPVFIANLISFAKGVEIDRLPEWFVIPMLLLQLLFPATLAYVIVVQRAMDVGMVLRQGMQYTLARGGVVVLQALIIIATIIFVARRVTSGQPRTVEVVTAIALAVLAVVLARRAAERLLGWIDRRFFREAYNSEQILADLSEQVRTMVETKPLLETVASRISDSLHVPRVALVLKDGDAYKPAHSQGFDDPPSVAFGFDSGTVQKLRAEHAPVAVYRSDPDSWTRELGDDEAQQLERLEAELVLPLAVKDKLHGFIALSRKQSEEPYSRTDLSLLKSVATQTGLALENSQLTAAIASEVAQRERLNRDLEIAREVQQRLFPQKYPAIPGLEYAGFCRPAQGVGGDYYDFVEVPNGQFGVAIGDVSGKGIPAALLMASLQASLRGQAINASADLASLMTNMNRLIFDASPSNRYATFFYGQFDPRTREFAYVNGGHNAPMVFRDGSVLRLEEGGPCVGLFGAARYAQGSLKLEAGDIVVGFTDGISEAMNHIDDEFGEERIVEVVGRCEGMPPALVIERMFEAADAFADGAPQHDDMTAVVVRVGA